MFLAVRNLLQDRLRLGLSVAGVSLALMLILFLNGFLAGIYRQAATYLEHAPGSVVVAPAGVTSFLGTGSLLPPGSEDAVRATDGVVEVSPILSLVLIPEFHGTKEATLVIGYDAARGGGPWRLTRGREPVSDDEVVLDAVLAERHGIGVGDRVELGGRSFTVSGLSGDTHSWTSSLIFTRKAALERLLLAPAGTSYLFITPAPGTSPVALAEYLRSLPGVEVMSKRLLVANNQKALGRIYDAPLTLMVGTAFMVGVLVVGMVIYAATLERQREYGVLKAVGARNRLLYRIVALQALFAAVPGAVAGTLLAFGLAHLVMILRPQFLIAIEPWAIAWTAGAGLLMAIAAALLPAWTIARLAPADVFRR